MDKSLSRDEWIEWLDMDATKIIISKMLSTRTNLFESLLFHQNINDIQSILGEIKGIDMCINIMKEVKQ